MISNGTPEDGLVYRCQEGTDRAVAAGSRTAITDDGSIICTFVVQTQLGSNDFKPMICRSGDGGRTWRDHGLIWPDLTDTWSIFGSVSRSPDGALCFFGSRTPIENAGESFWSEATCGLKQNELVWARSGDGTRTWSEPEVIPMPIAGSAEDAGAMCVTRAGRWICCYSPYNTFDPGIAVDRSQVVVVMSDDKGKTWSHTSMLRFDDAKSGGAEAWVVQLSDGRLLGTSWHTNHAPGGEDFPNAYALSHDEGATWTPTRSTGIMGQSTALAPLADGRALFIYNRRKQEPAGVWLAEVEPDEQDFGVLTNRLVWAAPQATQTGSKGEHDHWTDFAFGEPSVTVLPGGELLVTVWCIHSEGRDIRYVRLRPHC